MPILQKIQVPCHCKARGMTTAWSGGAYGIELSAWMWPYLHKELLGAQKVFDPIPSFLLLHFALLVTAANDPLPKYIDVPVVCSTILVAYFCPKYWCNCKKKLPKTWLAAKQILSQFQPNHNKLDRISMVMTSWVALTKYQNITFIRSCSNYLPLLPRDFIRIPTVGVDEHNNLLKTWQLTIQNFASWVSVTVPEGMGILSYDISQH